MASTRPTEIFKSLSDDNRLRIVNLLRRKALCVCELEVLLSMSQSMASRHLLRLKQGGIVSGTRDAQWIHYRLSDEFAADNSDLIAFLVRQSLCESRLSEDLQRLEAYIQSGMNCEQLLAQTEQKGTQIYHSDR